MPTPRSIALILLLILLGQPLLGLAMALDGKGALSHGGMGDELLVSSAPAVHHQASHHDHHGDVSPGAAHHDGCEQGLGGSLPCLCPVNAFCTSLTTLANRAMTVLQLRQFWLMPPDARLHQRLIDVEPRPPRDR